MFLKMYRKNKLTNLLAATLLVALLGFSINFLLSCISDCSVNLIFLCEEKKSNGELGSEKELESKLENFYTDCYSSVVSLFIFKNKRFFSSKKCSLYESYSCKIATPPPQC